MSQNYFYPCQQTQYPIQGPNAVSINIMQPQAFAGPQSCATMPINNGYSLYGANNQGMPIYPMNYNNMIPYNPYGMNNMANANNTSASDVNKMSMSNSTNLVEKTSAPEETQQTTKEEKKTKKVTPLTDEYVKSLENYMNDPNPKVRLIGAKELMARFKEDENRKDNPCLMPLLNKALRDPSAAVRFLGLTTLQLGYALGNDETVVILKEIQSQNKDKIGEDSLLASEILLNMAAPQKVEAPMTVGELEKAQEKQQKQQQNNNNQQLQGAA